MPYLVFHVDHIIAKQHLDEVTDDPNSLTWSCSTCNYRKGPNLVSIDPVTNEQSRLFNPRSEQWDVHFSLVDSVIVGLTPVGRATARLLGMNAPRLVRLRQKLVTLGEF